MTTQAEELKELTRLANAATKDLRQAMKEAREVTGRLIEDAIRESIEVEVKKGLDEYQETVKTAMDQAVAKVDSELAGLANLFLYGNKQGRGESLADIVAQRRGLTP